MRSEPKRARVRSIVAVVAFASIASCVPASSLPTGVPTERERSFVGFEFMRRDLLARSGLVPAWRTPFRAAACAITSDGYFVTAAHAIAGLGSPSLVLFERGIASPSATARIVSSSWPALDVAVLKIDARTTPFVWASAAEIGSSVAGLGVPDGWPSCYAGRVLEPLRARVALATRPSASIMVFDAPVARGDSGGPVATPDGRLIGICIALEPELGGEKQRRVIALRPGLDWLERLIDDDRARRR